MISICVAICMDIVLITSQHFAWYNRVSLINALNFLRNTQIKHSIARPWNSHEDVIKWKHFLRYWPFVRGIHRSPVNSPHKGQWRGALMFSLICAWINGWVMPRSHTMLPPYGSVVYGFLMWFLKIVRSCGLRLLWSQMLRRTRGDRKIHEIKNRKVTARRPGVTVRRPHGSCGYYKFAVRPP